jgi:long-chain acyl-CoA synthetase
MRTGGASGTVAAMTTTAAAPPTLEGPPAPPPAYRTLCDAFQATVGAHPDRVALRTPGDGVRITWGEYGERVRRLAGALAALGVGRGDAVGLLLGSRPEAALVDAAAIHLGGVCVALYVAAPTATHAYVLADTDARVLVTEHAFAGAVPTLHRNCPDLEHVLYVDAEPALDAVKPPAGYDFAAAWRAVAPVDPAALLYTSGTTGAPKGVVHTHRNSVALVAAFSAGLPPTTEPVTRVAFIPFGHAGERYAGHYRAMLCGSTATFCADPAQVPEVLREARPTYLLAPPGVWERLAAAGSASEAGLERLTQAVVTGAPPGVPMVRRLQDLGLPLVELYALSEVLCTMTRPGPGDLGTCGVPLPGTTVRLADDGEVLVRSVSATRGYHRRPAQTAALIDIDGWVHTGDVGEIDAGRLRLLGRRDERMVSALGHNLDPAPIEAAVKAECPLVAHVCAIGDRRPHVVALVTVNGDRDDPATLAAVEDAIGVANAKLSGPARIRRHAVLSVAWTPGGDELTPTMKLRRRAIAARYAGQIEALYDGAAARA